MSTLRVDNFGPSAGGTSYSARGIAKAWVNFNGTGTIAARDSENVSSLTDNGTGDYTVSFTNLFSSPDYVVSGYGHSNLAATHHAHQELWGSNIFAGSFRFKMSYATINYYDTEYTMNSAHGDLA